MVRQLRILRGENYARRRFRWPWDAIALASLIVVVMAAWRGSSRADIARSRVRLILPVTDGALAGDCSEGEITVQHGTRALWICDDAHHWWNP